MKNFIKAMDDLPWIVKIILSLPVLDLIWAIYRIIKGASNKNILMLVIGILWIVFGSLSIFWIVDLVCSIFFRRPIIFA